MATLHRPFNVDSTEAAALLVKAMHQVADMAPVIISPAASIMAGHAGEPAVGLALAVMQLHHYMHGCRKGDHNWPE